MEALIKPLEDRAIPKDVRWVSKIIDQPPKMGERLPFAAVHRVSGDRFRPPDTLRPQKDQPLAVLVEIYPCESHQQSLMALLDAAIAHLGVPEDLLENAERPLHLSAYAELAPTLALLFLVHHALVFLDTPIGHVLRIGCGPMNRFCLPSIASIAPHLLLLAMEQVG